MAAITTQLLLLGIRYIPIMPLYSALPCLDLYFVDLYTTLSTCNSTLPTIDPVIAVWEPELDGSCRLVSRPTEWPLKAKASRQQKKRAVNRRTLKSRLNSLPPPNYY